MASSVVPVDSTDLLDSSDAATCIKQSDSNRDIGNDLNNEKTLKVSANDQQCSDNQNQNGDNNNNNNDNNKTTKAAKRAICPTCDRPTPRACICSALPTKRIHLEHCTVLVLQHPHETRVKNRSLPLIELCLDPCSIKVITGRRLGDQNVTPEIKNLLSRQHVMLLYPAKDEETLRKVVDFSQALDSILDQQQRQQQQRQHSEPEQKTHNKSESSNSNNNDSSLSLSSSTSSSTNDSDKITVIFLDATWTYASQMHRANLKENQYPDHMMYVSLTPTLPQPKKQVSLPTTTLDMSSSDSDAVAVAAETAATFTANADAEKLGQRCPPQPSFIPRRFAHVRTPPNDDCLSTAECIAWVISAMEETFSEKAQLTQQSEVAITTNTIATTATATTTITATISESIYDRLMKPLDLMNEQWKSFTENHGGDKMRPASGKRQNEKPHRNTSAQSKQARCDDKDP